MSEAIAFFGGLIAMTIVWFVHDTKYNPYKRGYADGVNDGIQEVMKDLPKLTSDSKNTATWLIRKWGDDAKCSNCGHTFKDVYDMDNHDRFCRFCGRKMIGVKMHEISDRKM